MIIRTLLQRSTSNQRFERLLILSSLRSAEVISALRDHLVIGMTETAAAAINGVDIANFRRSLNNLENISQVIEEIKEIDYRKQTTTTKEVS